MIDTGSATVPEKEIDLEEEVEEAEPLESHEPEVADSTFSQEEIKAIVLEFFLKNLELALRGKLGEDVFATLEPQTSQTAFFQLMTPEVEEWPESARRLLQEQELRSSSYLKRLILASISEAVERRLSSLRPDDEQIHRFVNRHAMHIYREAMKFINIICQRIQHDTAAVRVSPGEGIPDNHSAADVVWDVVDSTMFSDRLREAFQRAWCQLTSTERTVLVEHLQSRWGVKIEEDMTDGRPVVKLDEIRADEQERALARAKAILAHHLGELFD